MKTKHRAVILILIPILAAVILLSLMVGRYSVTPLELFGNGEDTVAETVLFNIRIPRIALACLVGCCLSAAGTAYQGVFGNPLASPDILGASNGAGFGAALGIILGASSRGVAALAFLFGIATVLLVLLIASHSQGKKTLTLVLSGIVVSSLLSAGTSFLKLVADHSNRLPEITYWLMGSLSGARKDEVLFALIPMIPGLVVLLLLRWRINILTLGDDEARALGVDTGKLRLTVILCATLITAASVSLCGMIGWVGLVIPHLARRFVGNDNRILLPVSMLMGAIFLLIVDNIARCLMSVEIPIGILTSVVGAPFFIWLIVRKEELR